jgi:hypothetical protein
MNMISIIFESINNMTKEKKKTNYGQILEKYLSSNPGSLEYITLRSELKNHLTDPGIFERSETAGEDLRDEARIILDAFEAITNGMHNPEVISSMETISDNSLLSLWRELIYAIQAFYNKDYTEMKQRLENIEPDSALNMYKPILLHLSGITQTKGSNNKQKNFIDNIIKDRSFIRSVISQLIESLDYDMEDLFIETANLMIQDLIKNYKETASRFAIWCIETASKYKYSPSDIIANCKKIFGNTVTYRITAIALSKEEPDISLLFWIQSLISRLKSKDLSISETGAYFTIISRIAGDIKNSSDNFYLESLKALILTLKSDLIHKFPNRDVSNSLFSNPFESLIFLSTQYSDMNENIQRHKGLNNNSDILSRKSTEEKSNPIQLSLFD